MTDRETDRAKEEAELQEKLFNPHVNSNDEAHRDTGLASPPIEHDEDPMVTRPWAPRADEGSDVDPAGRPRR